MLKERPACQQVYLLPTREGKQALYFFHHRKPSNRRPLEKIQNKKVLQVQPLCCVPKQDCYVVIPYIPQTQYTTVIV